jgi:hypothetical protein
MATHPGAQSLIHLRSRQIRYKVAEGLRRGMVQRLQGVEAGHSWQGTPHPPLRSTFSLKRRGDRDNLSKVVAPIASPRRRRRKSPFADKSSWADKPSKRDSPAPPIPALPAPARPCYVNPVRRHSSAVEQRFCKPKVGGSIPSAGTGLQYNVVSARHPLYIHRPSKRSVKKRNYIIQLSNQHTLQSYLYLSEKYIITITLMLAITIAIVKAFSV